MKFNLLKTLYDSYWVATFVSKQQQQQQHQNQQQTYKGKFQQLKFIIFQRKGCKHFMNPLKVVYRRRYFLES